jgi:hypothetical protein
MRRLSSVIVIESSMQILHTILARFTARILTKNYEESIAACCLVSLGLQELSEQQAGEQTIRSIGELPVWNSVRIAEAQTCFETTIVTLATVISNHMKKKRRQMRRGQLDNKTLLVSHEDEDAKEEESHEIDVHDTDGDDREADETEEERRL